MKQYVGIDPGVSGAIAVVVDGVPTISSMPRKKININKRTRNVVDALRLRDFFSEYDKKECHVTIEQLHGMPGMGGTHMFAFGKGYGYVEMALFCVGIIPHYVTPQAWKKEFGLAGADKNDSIKKALELFPYSKDQINNHDGRAEALLIAEYARRKL